MLEHNGGDSQMNADDSFDKELELFMENATKDYEIIRQKEAIALNQAGTKLLHAKASQRYEAAELGTLRYEVIRDELREQVTEFVTLNFPDINPDRIIAVIEQEIHRRITVLADKEWELLNESLTIMRDYILETNEKPTPDQAYLYRAKKFKNLAYGLISLGLPKDNVAIKVLQSYLPGDTDPDSADMNWFLTQELETLTEHEALKADITFNEGIFLILQREELADDNDYERYFQECRRLAHDVARILKHSELSEAQKDAAIENLAHEFALTADLAQKIVQYTRSNISLIK